MHGRCCLNWVVRGPVLQPFTSKLCLKASEKTSNILVRPAKAVVDCLFDLKVPRVLSSIVVLNDCLANNDIAQEGIIAANLRNPTADSDNQS